MAKKQYPKLTHQLSTLQIPLRTTYLNNAKRKTKRYLAIAFGVTTLGLGPLIGHFLTSKKADKAEQQPAPIVKTVEPAATTRPPIVHNVHPVTFTNTTAAVSPQQAAQQNVQAPIQSNPASPQIEPAKTNITSLVLRNISSEKLYEAQKNLLELNEGKKVEFYLLNGKVHVGVGCNIQDNPAIAIKIGLKVIKQEGKDKRVLTPQELKTLLASFSTLSDAQLKKEIKKYSIPNNEVYRLLKATYIDFYNNASTIFKKSDVDFANLPIGIQMGVMDTIFRVGKNSFRKNFTKAQRKIQEFSKLPPNSDKYESSYFSVIQELGLGLIDATTNTFRDDPSARRAMRLWYIGLTEMGHQGSGFLGLLRGANVKTTAAYLAKNPIPVDHFNGIAANILEQNAAIKCVCPLIQVYHPTLTEESFLMTVKNFRSRPTPKQSTQKAL